MNEELVIKLLESATNQEWIAEHRFHLVRRWRFDFACISHKIAIEINGGVWANMRHNRASGYIKDLEKLNNAIECGWRVLQYISVDDMSNNIEQIKNVVRNWMIK